MESILTAKGLTKKFSKFTLGGLDSLLLSDSVSRTVFEGLALSCHKDRLETQGAVCERPMLQQLIIGILRYAEEKR